MELNLSLKDVQIWSDSNSERLCVMAVHELSHVYLASVLSCFMIWKAQMSKHISLVISLSLRMLLSLKQLLTNDVFEGVFMSEVSLYPTSLCECLDFSHGVCSCPMSMSLLMISWLRSGVGCAWASSSSSEAGLPLVLVLGLLTAGAPPGKCVGSAGCSTQAWWLHAPGSGAPGRSY